MRKLFFTITFIIFFCNVNVIAHVREKIQFRFHANSESSHNGIKRYPIHIPEVWLDGHYLIFPCEIGEMQMEIYKENKLIYITTIEEDSSKIEIPDYINGLLEISISDSIHTYICDIEI